MFNLKKIILIFLLIAFLVLLLVSFSLAEEEKEKPLEIQYPEVGEWRPETVEQAVLPQYIKYIFNFAVAIAGLVAFGALIYGGFRYITSVGAPTAQIEAKDQIFAGIIGLVILLSSYLILTTINPQLVLLKSPEPLRITATEIPGVYLSTETSFPSDENIETDKKKVYHLTSSIDDLSSIVDGDIKSLKIVNQYIIEIEGKKPVILEPDFYYGVILHTKKNRQGDCSYFRTNPPDITPASITVFQEVETGKGKVKVCNKPEVIGTDEEDKYCEPLLKQTDPEFKALPGKVDKNVWQIEVPKGWLLILRGNKKCAAFDKSVSDLKGYEINKCSAWWEFWFWAIYDSCVTEYALFPTK